VKIQAYLPVFNEADVLPYVLAHLRQQGVDVHIIDGWSTDHSDDFAIGKWVETEDLIEPVPRVTMEYFPDDDDHIWNCRRMLSHVQKLAAKSKADWCGLSDADEWRHTDRAGERLVDGVARVDAEGYNCIDHRVYAFWPHDDNWDGRTSPEQYFRYFNESDPICGLPQRKFWKNTGKPVDLVSSGGHEARFPGRRTYPERWVMKHYPFRSSQQARAKLRTRIERRCHEEHKAGWGVHYDGYVATPEFWKPRDLKEWKA